jgi:hypothetical protein
MPNTWDTHLLAKWMKTPSSEGISLQKLRNPRETTLKWDNNKERVFLLCRNKFNPETI